MKPTIALPFINRILTDYEKLQTVFSNHSIKRVVHLAAQAGVRHGLTHPHEYLDSNITSFLNILEVCRQNKIEHLIFASSSSVYGANTIMPFSVSHNVDHPLSLYAATKKSNELMAHSYATNFDLPVTGLRFFSAYGPMGRPDMALFMFTKSILEDKPIDVFNNGEMKRDFTYIDDLVDGMFNLIDHIPRGSENWDSNNPDPSLSFAPYRLFNIGNNSPIALMDFIAAIEDELGKKAKINFKPIQTGDVPIAFADATSLKNEIEYNPMTSVKRRNKKVYSLVSGIL